MKFTFKFALTIATCLCLALVGCSKEDEPDNDKNSDTSGGYGKLDGNLITIGGTRDLTYTGCVLLGTVDFPRITSDHTYGVVYMEAVETENFDYDLKLVYGGHNGKYDKEEYDCIAIKITNSTADGKFEKELVNLKPDTKYYYRAYVRMGENTNYSGVEYFTTLDPSSEIQMTTSDATDLFAVAGTMNGAVNVGNLRDVNEDQRYGFIYSSDPRLSTAETLTYEYYEKWNNNHFETEDEMDSPSRVTTTENMNGRIICEVERLKPGTSYYYRSFFSWNGKYFYSPVVKTLTTLGSSQITVGTDKVEDITASSAMLSGTVPFSKIGLGSVRAGFMISSVYSNSSEFDPEEAVAWSQRYNYPDAAVYYVDKEITDKDFSYYIFGLNESTSYYVCAYVYLGEFDDEPYYIKGNIQYFRTLDSDQNNDEIE